MFSGASPIVVRVILRTVGSHSILDAGLQSTFAERTKSSLRLRGETGETSYDLVLVEAATEEIIPTQHVRTPS